jgi:hypothetical protein
MTQPTVADDHIALQKLATEYAYAIDRREWHRLDDVFLPDATIDYTATGGIAASYAVIKEWLPKSLKVFSKTMHLMGNFQFDIDGDTGRGSIACYNPMVIRRLLGGTRHTVVYGIWYHDTYVRTPDGWRIQTRRQEASYTAHVPLWMRLGAAVVARRSPRNPTR